MENRLFSNKRLIQLIIPLVIEQGLTILVGKATISTWVWFPGNWFHGRVKTPALSAWKAVYSRPRALEPPPFEQPTMIVR